MAIYGNHLRRGVILRFPPGMGEHLMALCNAFLASNVDGDPQNLPPTRTVDIHSLNYNPTGFMFYAQSTNWLAPGDGYTRDEATPSAGRRVAIALSCPAEDPSAVFVVVRPDNTTTSEERFLMEDVAFTTIMAPVGAAAPAAPNREQRGGRAPPHDRAPHGPPVRRMIQMEITCSTSSRRILLDVLRSRDTRAPLVPKEVALACQRFVMAAHGRTVTGQGTPPPLAVGTDAAAAAALDANAVEDTGETSDDGAHGHAPRAPPPLDVAEVPPEVPPLPPEVPPAPPALEVQLYLRGRRGRFFLCVTWHDTYVTLVALSCELVRRSVPPSRLSPAAIATWCPLRARLNRGSLSWLRP